MSTPDTLSSTLPPKPSTDLTGRLIGDFQVLRRLGSGGMADVYLAEQTSLRRKVAFKALKEHLAGDDSFVRRFWNEAQAAAALTHANIVQIYEVGHGQGVYYIAQEYVPGRNLKQLIDQCNVDEQLISPSLAVNILRQVTAAIGKAQTQKIVHRDVKPENILLSVDGLAKVADFGLARIGDGGRNDLTQVGVTMGTPLYMSPEQVEGKELDARSDLYSLGVAIYHALAGHPPFQGETALSIAIMHLKEEPPALAEQRQDLPPALCDIIHKLMSKKKDDRFQSPNELLKELRSLEVEGPDDWPTELSEWSTADLLAVGSLDATQQLNNAMQTIALQSQRRKQWLIAGMAAVVLFLFAGAAAAWFTRPVSALTEARNNPPPIEEHQTAREQYLYATLVPSEEAFRSVERLFPVMKNGVTNPSNKYYALRANQRLVEHYFDNGDFQDALNTSRKIAATADGEPVFESFAIAGEALALLEMKRTADARAKLATLIPIYSSLEDNEVRRRLLLAVEKYGIEFAGGE